MNNKESNNIMNVEEIKFQLVCLGFKVQDDGVFVKLASQDNCPVVWHAYPKRCNCRSIS